MNANENDYYIHWQYAGQFLGSGAKYKIVVERLLAAIGDRGVVS